MKQTPAAIITLAAAILGAGAAVALSASLQPGGISTGLQTAGVILAVLAVACGIVGAGSLIRACLYDHDVAVGVYARLDLLEELVYLERLSLEHKQRTREIRGSGLDSSSGSSTGGITTERERRRRDVA